MQNKQLSRFTEYIPVIYIYNIICIIPQTNTIFGRCLLLLYYRRFSSSSVRYDYHRKAWEGTAVLSRAAAADIGTVFNAEPTHTNRRTIRQYCCCCTAYSSSSSSSYRYDGMIQTCSVVMSRLALESSRSHVCTCMYTAGAVSLFLCHMTHIYMTHVFVPPNTTIVVL